MNPLGSQRSFRSPAQHEEVDRKAVGAFGEWVAADYLASQGARVIDRNVRCGRGEIDLLVDLDGDRVAIEVKTLVVRSVDDDPLIHFSEAKAATVRTAAAGLQPAVFRIDVIAVSLRPEAVELRWIPHAG